MDVDLACGKFSYQGHYYTSIFNPHKTEIYELIDEERLKIECLYNWDSISKRFKAFLDDLYAINGEFSCSKIIQNHFNDNLNNDPLLAFLWYKQEKLYFNQCFPDGQRKDIVVRIIDREPEKKKKDALVIIFKLPLLDENDMKVIINQGHRLQISKQ